MSGTDAREQGAKPAGPPQVAGGQAEGPVPGLAAGHYRRRGRGWLVAAVVVVLVAAGVVAADAAGAFRAAKPTATTGGYKTGTATVKRRSLTSQTQVDATLGNAGSYTVVVPSAGSAGSGGGSGGGGSAVGSSPGTITWLPAVGQVIRRGQVLYRVSGSPVVLLYGQVPAYEDLSEGMTGADVAELNADLVKLGYASAAALGPRSGWDYFSAETAYALEQLQSKLGLTVTGTLPLGQAAFLPGPAQVTGLGTGVVPGVPATPGSVVLTASSVTPVVTIGLDASQQTEVKTGDKVSVTLPSGATTPGVISEVSSVATSPSSSDNGSGSGSGSGGSDNGSGSGSATITVLVALTDPKAAGRLNQAPVEVTITTGAVSDALVVPVNALLAQPGGGYAVEVTGPHGHHLVSVTPGLFDDAAGLVQVTSTRLLPGQHVVVPGL
jgi:Putative peptidoglycan binding domain